MATGTASQHPGPFDNISEDRFGRPYEGDGLSFKRSDEQMAKMIRLDGSDYPDLDPNGGDLVGPSKPQSNFVYNCE
jgi:hypothetical protein